MNKKTRAEGQIKKGPCRPGLDILDIQAISRLKPSENGNFSSGNIIERLGFKLPAVGLRRVSSLLAGRCFAAAALRRAGVLGWSGAHWVGRLAA
jgi:hypothetical protein